MRRLALVGIVMLAGSRTARADAYDSALSQAIVAKEKALDSNAPADWEETLRAFEVVDAMKPSADAKYELATAAAKLRADDLAFEWFEDALALGLGGTAQGKAQFFVEQRRGEMGRLQVHGPPGVELRILRRRRGVLPLAHAIVVFAGDVEIEIHGAPPSETRRVVHVSVAASATVELDLAVPNPSVPIAETPPTPATTYGTPLVLTGAGLVVLGTVGVVAASLSIPAHRDAIVSLCPPEKLDDDRCYAAPTSEHESYAEHRGALRTWTAVRTVSFVTLGVGAAVAIAGVYRLVVERSEKRVAYVPLVIATERAVVFGLEGVF